MRRKRLSVKGYGYTRILILIACFIWVVSATNLIMNRKDNSNLSLEEAFCANVYSNLRADIYGMGELNLKNDTTQTKKMILMDIAKKLDINQYTISEDADGVHLSQLSKNGEVAIDVLDRDEAFYLRASVTINKGFAAIKAYKKVLNECFEQFGVDEDINVSMSGIVNGRLDATQMEHLSGKFLKSMSAKEVMAGTMEEAYTVYAYSKNINEFMNVGKNKVNINVTMNYDELDGNTIVRLSTPVYNGDY